MTSILKKTEQLLFVTVIQCSRKELKLKISKRTLRRNLSGRDLKRSGFPRFGKSGSFCAKKFVGEVVRQTGQMFKFRCANHSEEPLKAKIMSAETRECNRDRLARMCGF